MEEEVLEVEQSNDQLNQMQEALVARFRYLDSHLHESEAAHGAKKPKKAVVLDIAEEVAQICGDTMVSDQAAPITQAKQVTQTKKKTLAEILLDYDAMCTKEKTDKLNKLVSEALKCLEI